MGKFNVLLLCMSGAQQFCIYLTSGSITLQ